MKCPHCYREIHFEADGAWTYKIEEPAHELLDGYAIVHGFCPACEELLVLYQEGEFKRSEGYSRLTSTYTERFLFPTALTRFVPAEVPDTLAKDFKDASTIVSLSPKASAALSRRILQQVLRDAIGVKPGNLSCEIDQYVADQSIPSHLSDAVDAVRNVGNFAAHPLKNTNTGEVIDVEPGEAEWLLDVLEGMCDFHFVQPKRMLERKEALNRKLRSIGKPLMKEAADDQT